MRLLIVYLFVFVLAPGTFLSAQQATPAPDPASQADPSKQTPPPSPGQQEVQSVAGELSRVDDSLKLFWIKTVAGEEMQFSYTKETPVTGADKSAEGLQELSTGGTQVRVQYETKGGKNTAVKIEIQSQTI